MRKTNYECSQPHHAIYEFDVSEINFQYMVICTRFRDSELYKLNPPIYGNTINYYITHRHLLESLVCDKCLYQDKKLYLFNKLIYNGGPLVYPGIYYYRLENWGLE